MILSQKLPSKLEVIPAFISEFLEKTKSLSIKKEVIFDIRLSLEEAISNAIRHGNQRNEDLFVAVDIQVKDNVLIVEVKDQGQGFDFNSLPDPSDDENITKTFGRGVFLIRNLMDNVEFFDNGRGIRMKKCLKNGGG